MLHTLDFVMPVEKSLPPDVCQDLITKFDQLESNLVDRDNEWQKFKELNISLTEGFEVEVEKLQTVAQHLMAFYKKEMGVKYFPENFKLEQFRMKRYEPDGKDQFDWHVDVGDYDSARRFMVMFFYLNTVEEGGETAFHWQEDDEYAIRVEPNEGTAVMFPPFWTHPHKGMMPKSGRKYIVSTYAHFI